ncbi:multiple epidermal growth factor-like domains protein 6 [Plakobranchus ocellatus]|uniref:Multiple epidermal growth factor-like domains protein 6 n=1 Tax=Plakobranchus ocellatus TaxID=259542 RepID=A0AAV4BVD5_9GAST|nr:multiple epidermal growth factor-like domains protein 6 [Plakobranchus ocellatus]
MCAINDIHDQEKHSICTHTVFYVICRSYAVFFVINSADRRHQYMHSQTCSQAGWFGNNCEFQCHCANNTECDRITGDCSNGCEPQWFGPACQYENLSRTRIFSRIEGSLPTWDTRKFYCTQARRSKGESPRLGRCVQAVYHITCQTCLKQYVRQTAKQSEPDLTATSNNQQQLDIPVT